MEFERKVAALAVKLAAVPSDGRAALEKSAAAMGAKAFDFSGGLPKEEPLVKAAKSLLGATRRYSVT